MPADHTGDDARRALGFLGLAETAALADAGVLLPAPATVLISPGVGLAPGVVVWPGVVLFSDAPGSLTVGAGTQLHGGTRIAASGGGRVTIGDEAEIGDEGGFTVKADAGHRIEIGSRARLLGNGSMTLSNRIGDGAQVLGPIRMQACTLAGGGSWREPDPDERGAVLKGAGVARGISLPRGTVIQAFGLFAGEPVRRQTEFHPKGG
jgi:carbonic anhydrase/acetyltransferase-like protein (isoleucine patch superfamily)